MIFREITIEDIPALFEVRTQTDENRLTLEELHSLGIDEKSVKERMETTFKGWLCEFEGRVVGFAMGNRATGELWVIAVLPGYTCRGIGKRLLDLVEEWLFAQGCKRLWLTTDIDTTLRAYSFYLHNGWFDDRIEDGLRYMYKENRDN